MSSATWRLADLLRQASFFAQGSWLGGMPLQAVRKDLEEERLSVKTLRARRSGLCVIDL
jgi:hypothetical protein